MTEIDVKALRARADAATGHSWSSQGYSLPEQGIGIIAWPEGYHECGPSKGLVCWVTLHPTEMVAEDPSRAEKVAAFISASKTDIPALCDAYEAQAKEIERLKGLLREAQNALVEFSEFEIPDYVMGQYLKVRVEQITWMGEHDLKPSSFRTARALSTKLTKELEND